MAKNINSESLELSKESGGYTSMRKFLLEIKYRGKNMFKGVAVTPTKGNVNAMMLIIIMRRSGDLKKSKKTADEGSKYISEQFIKEFVKEVGEQNAKKVIAHTVMERFRTNNLEIKQEDIVKIRDKDSLSSLSGETGQRTTQSTRD